MTQTVFEKLKKALGLDGILASHKDHNHHHHHKSCEKCADGKCEHPADKECSEDDCCCGGACRTDGNSDGCTCEEDGDCVCGGDGECQCGVHTHK